MRILACNILVDFINGQMESTYMFNLDGLIPKLCQLAQEVGDDERALRLRSAGMQALANMVWFMGEQSHISMDFDNVSLLFLLLVLISVFYLRDVLLENYLDLQMKPEDGKEARQHSQSQDQLAKEATTVRRVLKPLFHHFDVENHGSSDIGVACSVILYLQLLLEELGGNSHLLLSILIKHLDHKNVAKQPRVQIHIVDVATQLAQNAFPDALFHQLLLAMAHPDHETRVGAHSVVSVVLCHLGSPLGVRSGQGYFTSCF
ncbi:hypothetical protein Pint_07062 [Pistacia integerrima]|uniref:Uncharacterized protein n=1 Tax=Pistacia integerrima TaxID=434235 RepID=A0ACC0XU88_9ROSI|nr:hypothetical protein Pint_07062 [Pistacia integerrima]